jgi:hypothetical protein
MYSALIRDFAGTRFAPFGSVKRFSRFVGDRHHDVAQLHIYRASVNGKKRQSRGKLTRVHKTSLAMQVVKSSKKVSKAGAQPVIRDYARSLFPVI